MTKNKKHTNTKKRSQVSKMTNRPKRILWGFAGIFAMASLALLGISYGQIDSTISANAPKGYTSDNALRRLSNRLPDVASRYHLSPDELKDLLKKDTTLRLSDKDELFYVEPAPTIDEINRALSELTSPNQTSSSASQEDIVPLESALDMHSKPGSAKTLFLDFDGHTTSEEHWVKYNDGNPVISEPYDNDGDPLTFSASERQSIIDTWASVAEDFSHLDINVTTKDPGIDALIKSGTSDTTYGNRTVITPTNFYSSSAGGVSYVGTWATSKDYVSYVFICCDVAETKYIAEAASHESGHSVGLHHDGTATEAYYGGHGEWAPIMGVGYYKSLTQWSKGEYLDANQKQDDITFPLRYGIDNRPDEAGGTVSSASALNLSSTGSLNGNVGSSSDTDIYVFNWSGGTVTFDVGTPVFAQNFGSEPRAIGNLDPSVRILNVLGVAEAKSNPDGAQTASVSKFLLPGKYYLEIKGSGHMDPLTSGYSSYSSVGQYKIRQR